MKVADQCRHSVCIISISRIPKLHALSLIDASWSNADPTIWSLVEVCVAIVCACAIVYRPLVNWLFRIRITNQDSAGSSSQRQSRSRSRPKLSGVGVDEWNRNGWNWNGALVKMERVRVVGKHGEDCGGREPAVRVEERGSFQQLGAGEDGKV